MRKKNGPAESLWDSPVYLWWSLRWKRLEVEMCFKSRVNKRRSDWWWQRWRWYISCIYFRRQGRFIGHQYGEGHGPIWLDNLICLGWERQLENCIHDGWGSYGCGHRNDVSIRCNGGSIHSTKFTTTRHTTETTSKPPSISGRPTVIASRDITV